jgi:hypothetical protein
MIAWVRCRCGWRPVRRIGSGCRARGRADGPPCGPSGRWSGSGRVGARTAKRSGRSLGELHRGRSAGSTTGATAPCGDRLGLPRHFAGLLGDTLQLRRRPGRDRLATGGAPFPSGPRTPCGTCRRGSQLVSSSTRSPRRCAAAWRAATPTRSRASPPWGAPRSGRPRPVTSTSRTASSWHSFRTSVFFPGFVTRRRERQARGSRPRRPGRNPRWSVRLV